MQKTNLSFIQNINYLSRNIHLLEEGRELLTPSAVRAIETAIKLPFEDIVADVKKGVTEYGKRKLDIDTNINAIKSVSHVKYDGVVIGGKESSHSVTYPIVETSRPEDLIEGIKDAISKYNLTAEDHNVAAIEDYDIQLVFAANSWSPKWLIRITDAVDHAADPTFTALGYVDLLVSASTEHEAKLNTLESSWYASSSSILMLGQSIHLILAAVRDAEASAILSHGHSMDAATSAAEAEQTKAEVGGLKAEVEAASAEFMGSLQFDVIGNYAAGIEVTSYKQVIKEGPEFWRAAAGTALPYTTTGNGMPEGEAFVPAGDAMLRQDLANPDKGAAMVARGVVAVDSIADLLALPEGQRKDGLRYLVKGYRSGSDMGGGEFYWSAVEPASRHNAGTVICSEVSFPSHSSESELADWYGIVTSQAAGCFIRTNKEFCVNSFGAMPNRKNMATANYYAIKRTVASAVDSRYKTSFSDGDVDDLYSNGKVIFGSGIYSIGKSNPLRPDVHTDIPATFKSYRRGLSFVGAGIEQTILMNDGESGDDFQFWENYSIPINDGRKANGYDKVNFHGISFHGPFSDASLRNYGVSHTRQDGSRVDAFKIYSTGWDKEFSFNECGFAGIDGLLDISGPSNGDKFVFYRCLISPIRDFVFKCDNNQSVANAFIECNYGLFGDFFRVGGKGGGGSQLWGGSCVVIPQFDDDGRTSATQMTKALVNLSVSGSPTKRGSYYDFHGLTFEFYNEQSKDVLAESPVTAGAFRVLFDDCHWTTVRDWQGTEIGIPTSTYPSVEIIGRIGGEVMFSNCVMSPYREFLVTNNATSQSMAATPVIIVTNTFCDQTVKLGNPLKENISNRVNVTSGMLDIFIDGISYLPINSNYDARLSVASDIKKIIGSQINLSGKTYDTHLKPLNRLWGADTAANKLSLPKHAVVSGVRIYRPASTSPASFTVRITNGKLDAEKVIYKEWTQPENKMMDINETLLIQGHGGLLAVESTASNLSGVDSFVSITYF